MRLILACALALAALAGPGLAREITPAEDREIPYSAAMPACHDPGVLKRITAAFAERELRFWNSALTIAAYDKIRPIAFRPWGLDTIPRRYCTATATTSDGKRRRVDYSVREDLGFIGGGYGVEWCVAGLDRNWGYAPACRMARP
jgi:hypothetical protein